MTQRKKQISCQDVMQLKVQGFTLSLALGASTCSRVATTHLNSVQTRCIVKRRGSEKSAFLAIFWVFMLLLGPELGVQCTYAYVRSYGHHRNELDTVVSKTIADRHFGWGELISDYRYRIVLPEELISSTERQICGNLCRKALFSDTDTLLNSN